METEGNNEPVVRPNPFITWAKRLGIAGFIFFTVKGLLWLIVPALIVWWTTK